MPDEVQSNLVGNQAQNQPGVVIPPESTEPQPQEAPPQVSQPVEKKIEEPQSNSSGGKTKRKIPLSVVLLALFITIVTALAIGTVFYVNSMKAKGNQITETQVGTTPFPVSPGPTHVPGYYEGEGFNFSFPTDLVLNEEISPKNTYIYLKKSGTTYYYFEILNQKEKSLMEGQPIEKQVEYNGNKWILHKSSEFCDTGSCGNLAQSYTLRVNDTVYTLVLDEGSKEVAETILSTFKFTDQNSSVDAEGESSLNIPADTSNWKTYKNAVHKFEFNHPQDLSILDEKDESNNYMLSFEGNKGSSDYYLFDLSVKPLPANSDLLSFVKANSQNNIVKPYDINSLKGYYWFGGGEYMSWHVYFEKNGKAYSFRYGRYEAGVFPEPAKEERILLDQILSTLKFTD